MMASTCRSNQSFTAWLLAHTKGPVRTKPKKSKVLRSLRACPEATAPQAKAHMGGNHVTGFSNSVTTDKRGTAIKPLFAPIFHLSIEIDSEKRLFGWVVL